MLFGGLNKSEKTIIGQVIRYSPNLNFIFVAIPWKCYKKKTIINIIIHFVNYKINVVKFIMISNPSSLYRKRIWNHLCETAV